MDLDIVKSILQNSGADISRFKLDNGNVNAEDDEKYESINPELTSALAKSLATLLCYKVSPAVQQRYSVRINLIEQLRDWSRITSRYSHLQTFTDGERTTKFAINLVNKYLTEDFLNKQSSVNILVKLGFAIIDMKSRNPTFDYKMDNIINRILYLNRTADSDVFLDTLIDNYEHLSLGLSTIENIYINRTGNLLEAPIVDFFMSFITKYEDGGPNPKDMRNKIDSLKNDCSYSVNQLLKYSSKSPRIFQLLCSIMKEILTRTNCSKMFVNFIQYVIHHIGKLCEDDKNNILDLYPRNLQCTVILLKIDPSLHTQNSKAYTLNKLRSIYIINKQEIPILLTHFPLWLVEFSDFISANDDLLLR